jgi:hypothetical protein
VVGKIAAGALGDGGTVYLDQGMKFQTVLLPDGYRMEAGCDSKKVVGIQLADCCAHFVSTMLLGELGLFNKMVSSNRIYRKRRFGSTSVYA